MVDLSYDPETGKIWRKGKEAGTLAPNGYLVIRAHGKLYYVHRMAWWLHHGQWPCHDLDHVNGNRVDNRLSNLRQATRSENLRNRGKNRNNTSGTKGVYWHKAAQKWMASIGVDGKNKYLGLFTSPEEASESYNLAAHRIHGEFAYLDL